MSTTDSTPPASGPNNDSLLVDESDTPPAGHHRVSTFASLRRSRIQLQAEDVLVVYHDLHFPRTKFGLRSHRWAGSILTVCGALKDVCATLHNAADREATRVGQVDHGYIKTAFDPEYSTVFYIHFQSRGSYSAKSNTTSDELPKSLLGLPPPQALWHKIDPGSWDAMLDYGTRTGGYYILVTDKPQNIMTFRGASSES